MTRSVPILAALLLLPACRESDPPRAVPSRDDGVLELSLCSFNIRYENPRDLGWRSWPRRVGSVVATIRRLDPDILGVQEALHGQAADLRASLPDYGFHGVGRDDGHRAGEYSAILYRADRFEPDPDEHGTFWLSDLPETPGSKTWGNEVIRCASWLRLTDRASGRGFYVFNTHFDHRHQQSREKSARLVADRIAARRRPDEPVVLLGDLNATEGNPAIRTLLAESTGLTDPYQFLHPDEPDRRTVHGWTGDTTGHARIDYVLVSAGARFLSADIDRNPDGGRPPSDHHPVWASVAWPAP